VIERGTIQLRRVPFSCVQSASVHSTVHSDQKGLELAHRPPHTLTSVHTRHTPTSPTVDKRYRSTLSAMDSTILDLLGDDLKRQAFQSGLKKLEAAPQLDLDALRLCIRLWPSLTPVPEPGYSDSSSGNPIESIESMASSQAPEGHTLAEELCNLVVARIPHEQLEPGHFYAMAEIMCSDASFANVLFREKIYPRLLALLSALSAQTLQRGDRMDEDEDGLRASIIKATAYLTLLKCSYWLPSHNFHVVDPNSLGLLSRFIGLSELDNVAHDAISAFLSLLKRGEPIVVAPPSNASQNWLQPHTTMGRVALAAPIIDGSFWGRLSMLELQDHKSGECLDLCMEIIIRGPISYSQMWMNYH
jgi:tRNA guanosine-2'-O-methyltransferase